MQTKSDQRDSGIYRILATLPPILNSLNRAKVKTNQTKITNWGWPSDFKIFLSYSLAIFLRSGKMSYSMSYNSILKMRQFLKYIYFFKYLWNNILLTTIYWFCSSSYDVCHVTEWKCTTINFESWSILALWNIYIDFSSLFGKIFFLSSHVNTWCQNLYLHFTGKIFMIKSNL